MKRAGRSLEGATVVIQGFGNVGIYAANFLTQAGAQTIAVSDSSGGVFNSKGLDLDLILHFKQEGGRLCDMVGAGDRITNSELLELPCDVLVPAALEGAINAENAASVQAGMIVEGANGPTTAEGDAALASRGIPVVPDILANAGGVVVSYFEWVQDLQGLFWDRESIQRGLEFRMTTAYDQVRQLAQNQKTSLRLAAHRLAVQRVANAMRPSGGHA